MPERNPVAPASFAATQLLFLTSPDCLSKPLFYVPSKKRELRFISGQICEFLKGLFVHGRYLTMSPESTQLCPGIIPTSFDDVCIKKK